MIRTSTNTATTTCDGTAIDGSDDPLTPTKLMISDSNSTAELSPFHDVVSTPSLSQEKTTTCDGGNNTIVQDCPVSSAVIDIDGLAESALGLSKLDGKKSKRGLYRVLFGCMFAYVVLGIWVSRPMHCSCYSFANMLTIIVACSRSTQSLNLSS